MIVSPSQLPTVEETRPVSTDTKPPYFLLGRDSFSYRCELVQASLESDLVAATEASQPGASTRTDKARRGCPSGVSAVFDSLSREKLKPFAQTCRTTTMRRSRSEGRSTA